MALPEYLLEDNLPENELVTEEEYFLREERALVRSEFLPVGPPGADGQRRGIIRQMSGGTPDHSGIAANVITSLRVALRGIGNRTCRVFTSDLKIHRLSGVNTYPDISVVCGPLKLYRKRRDTITNPVLVVEVLSPGTEDYDRDEKWESYQSIAELRHYLLIAADRPHVEIHTWQESRWTREEVDDLQGQITLPALGIVVAMADIYDLVEFSPVDAS